MGRSCPRLSRGAWRRSRDSLLERGGLEWLLPALYFLLSVGERWGGGRGWGGPPGPEQFDPSSSGRNEDLWLPALRTCLLRANVKTHNFMKMNARPSAVWWLQKLPGPLSSESPDGDKPDSSYPGLGSTKHSLRARLRLWIWGFHLHQ